MPAPLVRLPPEISPLAVTVLASVPATRLP